MRTKELNPTDEPKLEPMDDYETQGHLDTLIRAHQIMSDGDKMAKVHALAGRHDKAIKSIGDIKKAYDQKFGSGAGQNPLKAFGKSAMKQAKKASASAQAGSSESADDDSY